MKRIIPFFIVSLIILTKQTSLAMVCEDFFAEQAEITSSQETRPKTQELVTTEALRSSDVLQSSDAFFNQEGIDPQVAAEIKTFIRTAVVEKKYFLNLDYFKTVSKTLVDMRNRLPKLQKIKLSQAGMVDGLPKDIVSKIDKYFTTEQLSVLVETMVAQLQDRDPEHLHKIAPRTITSKYAKLKRLLDARKIALDFYTSEDYDIEANLGNAGRETHLTDEFGFSESELPAYIDAYKEVRKIFDNDLKKIEAHLKAQIYYNQRGKMFQDLDNKDYGPSLMRAMILQTLPPVLLTLQTYQRKWTHTTSSGRFVEDGANIFKGVFSMMGAMVGGGLLLLDLTTTGGLLTLGSTLIFGGMATLSLDFLIFGSMEQAKINKAYREFYGGEITNAMAEAWADDLDKAEGLASMNIEPVTHFKGKAHGKIRNTIAGIGQKFGNLRNARSQRRRGRQAALPAPQQETQEETRPAPKKANITTTAVHDAKIVKVKKQMSVEELTEIRSAAIKRYNALDMGLSEQTLDNQLSESEREGKSLLEKKRFKVLTQILNGVGDKGTVKIARIKAARIELVNIYRASLMIASKLGPASISEIADSQVVFDTFKDLKGTEVSLLSEDQIRQFRLTKKKLEGFRTSLKYIRSAVTGANQLTEYVVTARSLIKDGTIAGEDLKLGSAKWFLARVALNDLQVSLESLQGKQKSQLEELNSYSSPNPQENPGKIDLLARKIDDLIGAIEAIENSATVGIATEGNYRDYAKLKKEVAELYRDILRKFRKAPTCKSVESCESY